MFIIDSQTRDDLDLSSKSNKSIISFFDNTITIGGGDKIYEYFNSPISNILEIKHRQQAINYLSKRSIDTIFDKHIMIDLEKYIALPNEPYSEFPTLSILRRLIMKISLKERRRNFFIKRSICELSDLMCVLNDFFKSLSDQLEDSTLQELKKSYNSLTDNLDFNELKAISFNKISIIKIFKFDFLFRNLIREKIRNIFSIVYHLDALNAVGKISKKAEWSFPSFLNDEASDMIRIKNIFNPTINSPIKNDIIIERDKHLVFLTGANMTGKSTFLRSVGLCIFLSHLGFPVPADKMETCLFDGILTTINLGDDAQSGYSHFLNEINRISTIADQLGKTNRMVILFDELFKGTNYQDAYEATLELFKSIKHIDQSIFFISSHITEIADELTALNTINFNYMKTEVNKDGVIFKYLLTEGIARDKLGMWLLNKNKVFNKFKRIS